MPNRRGEKNTARRFSILAAAMVCAAAGLTRGEEGGRISYVSAASGSNRHDGLSAQSAWRSLDKANAAEPGAGDKALFRRGDAWRGTLAPRSGRDGVPIIYGAYGEGDRPLLLGSVGCNEPGDWHREGENVWAQVNITYRDNVVWNCEYSFEYWNRGQESTIRTRPIDC